MRIYKSYELQFDCKTINMVMDRQLSVISHEEIGEMKEFGISSLITNPGYSIISQKILRCLDHKSHLTFRLVSKSWKIQVDCPYFWMKKCVQKGMPKNLQVAWTELLQR